LSKVEEAKKVVEECRTSEGFRASAQFYPELWVRDLVFAEDCLLELGYSDTIRRHLESFLRLQRSNGQIPTALSSNRKRIFNQRFQSWTADSEILFIIGARKYAHYTGDAEFLRLHAEQLDRCLSFVESHVNAHGLVPGMDWRDALLNYAGRFLLANQLLLVDMYDLLDRRDSSLSLRQKIHQTFYSSDHGFYADFVWWDGDVLRKETRFDSLGNSLALLNDTALGDSAESVARAFEGGMTKFGYRNLFPPYRIQRAKSFATLKNLNAFLRNGAVFRNRPNYYQNSGIWPFVEGKIVHALLKLEMSREAIEATRMILSRSGCNEWYSPLTGTPKGSGHQLWTAAAIIEVSRVLP
jgi:hypothetical protein